MLGGLRVDEGASTVLARIKALDRAITSPRILRLEARGDRLRLAVDGELCGGSGVTVDSLAPSA